MLPSSFFKSPFLKNLKIAAIDDDPNILSTIGIMMRTAGIDAVLIESADDALRQLPEIHPDLILLDYMMPGMNGAEFYERILSDPQLEYVRSIPVVMLTAKTDNYEEQQDLLRKGMSAYLLKPFGFNELINIISNVLTLQEAKNENLRLNAELQRSRNYLQTLFNSIDDGISVQDLNYQIRSYNQSAAARFNAAEEPESVSDPEPNNHDSIFCYKTFFNQPSVCPFCKAAEMLKTGQAQFIEVSHPETRRHYQISFFPVKDAQGAIASFIETIRDITEKKKLELHLVESTRLAGMGALAMGVAHEINNPLCIILGFVQSLLKSLPHGDPVTDDLKIIEEESQRCATIVQDLLAYAKPGPIHKRPVVVRDIIQNSLALLRHHFQKKQIRVTESHDPNCPQLNVDPKKIQQVLINVLLNAVDSVPVNGRIHITGTSTNDENKVRIEIEDDGCGVDETLLPRIFDPFVTTKFGQGTGMGLSICRTIIHDHGGTIEIQSKKNSGTTVTITLPIEGN
jgi:signal transduction histidine kinase/CheY-like chemotaxis protein